ncbi:MAG: CoA-acylating methylmalonate-semialdehyde dehydrogenase [Anaerolineae bacterium]|nr:CoA-acylating methylmalonate-semialdehyde dehydrogenase [Anaerolineae bacterium]
MADRVKNYVNGEWVESSAEGTTPVINPATCELMAETPHSTREEVDAAAQAAYEAFLEWRQTPVVKRVRYLHNFKTLLEENFEELAKTVVKENGKTIDEARGEVLRGIESVEFAFAVPSLMTGFKVEDIAAGIYETAERQPIGVFAALTPFNFPMMVPLWFLPTAIACGNTYIIKPSPMTPLSMNLTYELLEESGLPEGVVNLVHGDAGTATAIMQHPLVKGVSFVGSSYVGKIVYETCAQYGKRVQVQGGAKNYLAVMPDADLEKSVANILGSAYGCAGQRCLAGSVLVAVGDIYEPLRDAIQEASAKLKVGYGLDGDTQMGTVVSTQAKERIERMIQKGVEEGAELLLDGRNLQVEGYEEGSFVGPTVFDKVTPEMTLAKEEIFGPVLSIMHVPDFETAVEAINTSRYGNAASIFTNNGHYAREFKYRVNAGNIGVNIGVAAPAAWFPFGGQKDSFFGDTHGQGPDSIQFFTDHKVIVERWFEQE